MSTRFTVAIPTRNRCDTLEWALRTCTAQDYPDLEIIVSDNFSSDRTEEIVRAAADERVRYVNPGRSLSMSENFEFALSHAGSGYITFLGDDDGLLPDALAELDPVLQELRSNALVWSMQNYYWPGFVEPSLANMLNMSLDQRPTVREVDAAALLRDVRDFRTKYVALPSPYFGFVRSDAIQRARGRSGTFFNSITPDIYSGVALASTIGTFHVSNRAYSISGQSKHSSGASQVTGTGANDKDSASSRFVRENTLPFHPELVYSPSIPILVAETFLQVRDHVGPTPELAIDFTAVISAALADQNFLLNAQVRDEVEGTVRAIAEQHGIAGYAEREIRRAHRLLAPRLALDAARLVVVNNPVFDCAPYGVRNIYDASLAFRTIVAKYPHRWGRSRATLLARVAKARRIVEAGLAKTRKA